MELIMKISILNKNYYPKQRVCTEKGMCGTCPTWKKGYCYGFFSIIITDEDLKKIINKVGEIVKKKGYITKDELKEIAKNYELKLTDRLLNHYCELGLIEHSIMKRLPGIPGTVSFWKEDTPKILYVIQNLKNKGYKIKLKEMKYWLDLLNLNEKSIEEIKEIQEEDSEFNRNIMFSLGIELYDKDYLLNRIPLKLFDYEKLITRLDIFKRVASLRAYIELDQEEITKIYDDSGTVTKVQYGISFTKSPIDDILDNPKININLDIPEIKVIYEKPVSKEVVFKKDGLIKVINY